MKKPIKYEWKPTRWYYSGGPKDMLQFTLTVPYGSVTVEKDEVLGKWFHKLYGSENTAGPFASAANAMQSAQHDYVEAVACALDYLSINCDVPASAAPAEDTEAFEEFAANVRKSVEG